MVQMPAWEAQQSQDPFKLGTLITKPERRDPFLSKNQASILKTTLTKSSSIQRFLQPTQKW